MEKSRRLFLTQCATLTATAIAAGPLKNKKKIINQADSLFSPTNAITIYSTCDLNGRIAPLPNGTGGLLKIKAAMDAEKARGLLLDAGGFLSGAENAAGREQLVLLMNTTGYQAAGLSSRELSAGELCLAELIPKMKFPLVNCNHEFTGELCGLVKPYHIMQSNGVRIGITGVCKPLKGIKYFDPLKSAGKTAGYLKAKEKCDFIICLSHLGDNENGPGPTNQALATRSENIDLVIGGGNAIVCNNALILFNGSQQEVILSQTTSHGLMAGKTSVLFDGNKQKKGLDIYSVVSAAPLNFQSMAEISQIKAKLAAV